MSPRLRDLSLLPVGFAIAFVGALCGIGGGLFTVPLLHYVRGLELKRAVATALVLVVTTTGFATLAELLRADRQLDGPLVACLAAGTLLGAQLGFRVAERIPTRALRGVFVVVLTAAGLRLAFAGPGGGEILPGDAGARALATAFAAGLGGGFLAPLLGIGGGLLMVPALFFGIPGMSFAMARASSLAAGAVGASRSLWLHARAGRVDLPAVAPLALGALGGAVAGVQVVHLEGATAVARMLLAGILFVTALRFLRDLLRPRS